MRCNVDLTDTLGLVLYLELLLTTAFIYSDNTLGHHLIYEYRKRCMSFMRKTVCSKIFCLEDGS